MAAEVVRLPPDNSAAACEAGLRLLRDSELEKLWPLD
jgi:hypothetical protein